MMDIDPLRIRDYAVAVPKFVDFPRKCNKCGCLETFTYDDGYHLCPMGHIWKED